VAACAAPGAPIVVWHQLQHRPHPGTQAPPPPRGRVRVTPLGSLDAIGGRLRRGRGPGARLSTCWGVGGAAERRAKSRDIPPEIFSASVLYIKCWRAPRRQVRRRCSRGCRMGAHLHGAWGGRAHAAVPRTSPAPPDRLVFIGGILGTRPANFTAWGAREGVVAPEKHCFGCPHLCGVPGKIQRYTF
jgi:hypothetical protein